MTRSSAPCAASFVKRTFPSSAAYKPSHKPESERPPRMRPAPKRGSRSSLGSGSIYEMASSDSHPVRLRQEKIMSRRTRYQQGSVQREKRRSGPDVWVFRWYEIGTDAKNKYRKAIVGTVDTLSNETSALKAAQALRIDANQETRRREPGRARLQCSLRITG